MNAISLVEQKTGHTKPAYTVFAERLLENFGNDEIPKKTKKAPKNEDTEDKMALHASWFLSVGNSSDPKTTQKRNKKKKK